MCVRVSECVCVCECACVRHLYGVAVDGLPAARHVHRPADLQDVVWHISRSARPVLHLPPLLPVIQHLTTNQIDTSHDRPSH